MGKRTRHARAEKKDVPARGTPASQNRWLRIWSRLVERDSFGVILLVAGLATGGALRAWLSLHDDGIYWPDEIYNSLEPAHRLVFGNGLIAWEFLEGARNWTLPGFIAALLKVSAVLGLSDPGQYLLVVRGALSALGVTTAYGSYLVARRLGVMPYFAACGALFFALIGPAVYFAPRALAEVVSALPVVLGMAFALPPTANRRSRILGASLLGLATLLRLQNGVFCVAFLCLIAARRRWAETREAALVLAAWALIFGLVDKLTWGSWFQSAVVYLRVSLILGAAPITGNSPASYYLAMFLESMPFVTVVVLALCFCGIRRAPGLAFVTAAFVLAHVLIPNKAYRYVLAALPLCGALSAVGLQELWSSNRRTTALVASAALCVAVLWSAATFRSLTFGDVGPYENTRPTVSAYDAWGSVNRLLITASRKSDLCGLRVETDQLTWIGGYSYFHRPVPLYGLLGPERDSGRYNYAIAAAGQGRGEVVAAEGDRVLVRLGTPCVADPDYDPRLPGYEDLRKALAS